MSDLPEGWVETSLGEVGKAVTGKTPSKNNLEHWGNVLDFITPTDFKGDSKFLSQVDKKLSSEGESAFKRLLIPSKSVIVTCIGSDMGKVAINKNDCVTNQQINSIIINQNKYDADFIHYLLKASYKVLRLYADGGSTMPIINKSTFESLTFAIPPLPEQKAIADMLSSFDEKIELLREQNKTLETLAQTIFKEWFVNFNYPDATGDMVESDNPLAGKTTERSPLEGESVSSNQLGLIPKGWRVGKLSEVAEFLNGLALQKYPPIDGNKTFPAIKIRELKQGITSVTDRVNTELDKKYIIDNGDILFSWSGSLEVVIWKYGKGALNQHLFKVSSNDYPKWFYYYWTLYHLRWFRSIAADKATTMGHIQRKHLDEAKVLIPNDDIMEQGTALFEPMIEKIIVTNEQIQTLSKTRDTLLPKLMSGQVRVGATLL